MLREKQKPRKRQEVVGLKSKVDCGYFVCSCQGGASLGAFGLATADIPWVLHRMDLTLMDQTFSSLDVPAGD